MACRCVPHGCGDLIVSGLEECESDANCPDLPGDSHYHCQDCVCTKCLAPNNHCLQDSDCPDNSDPNTFACCVNNTCGQCNIQCQTDADCTHNTPPGFIPCCLPRPGPGWCGSCDVSECGNGVVEEAAGENCEPPGSYCEGLTPSGSGTCSDQCVCVDNCVGEACEFERYEIEKRVKEAIEH